MVIPKRTCTSNDAREMASCGEYSDHFPPGTRASCALGVVWGSLLVGLVG